MKIYTKILLLSLGMLSTAVWSQQHYEVPPTSSTYADVPVISDKDVSYRRYQNNY